MNEADRAADYSERDVKAARSVLIELGQVLGGYRERFVVVGGAVPSLLYPDAFPQHIGTLDIDLELDAHALSGSAYAELIALLERKGYERRVAGLKPFQLRRLIRVDAGSPVAVIVDLLMPRDANPEKHSPPLVDGLRVQGVDGGEIALSHFLSLEVRGVMPDGRRNAVQLRVATIPALLVMKGYALVGREKKKDAYDIYYSVKHFDGGIPALAVACRPLLGDPVAVRGFENIRAKFGQEDDYGPATVCLFLQESAALGDMTPEQAQTDAFRQVSSWLNALGLA